MNIGLDLDGVIYDYHSVLYREVTYFMGVTSSYEDFWVDEIHSYNNLKQEFLIKLPHIYTALVPTLNMLSMLDRLAKDNEFFYITARPKEVHRITIEYLKKYNFPYYENIFFTNDKTRECRYLSLDIYFEDMLKYALPLSIFCTVYLIDKPWNKQENLNKNIIRVGHVLEMERIVNGVN